MNWENLGEDYMGYEFEFISPLPKDLECPICRRAMRNPRQMCPCGHQCCEFCFVQSQRSDDSLICPVDRNSLSEDEGHFPDNSLKRKIESLEVKCLQCNRGCEWVGEIRNYNNHSEVCVYQNETCEDCSMEMERMCFQDHKLLHCPERIVSCEYCQEDVIFSDLKEHNEQCQQYPLECPQSCGIQNLPRNETESHVKNDCVNTVVSCPYSEVGCTFKDMRCKLEVHKEDHLRRIPQQLADLQREMKSGLAELGCLVESLQLQLDQAEKKIVQLENNTAQMDLRFSITESRVDVESVNETTKALERGLAQSQRKNAELEKEIAQLKLTTAQLRQSVSLNTRDRKRKGSKASSRRRKRKPTLTFVGCSDEDEIESDHLCPTGEESNTL